MWLYVFTALVNQGWKWVPRIGYTLQPCRTQRSEQNITVYYCNAGSGIVSCTYRCWEI